MLISNALDYWNQAANTRLSALDTLLASSGPGSTITNCFEQVDEEIVALLSVLASVRTRRNRLPTAARLPPELLAHIFSFLAACERPRRRAPIKLGWIKVTHVCSRWQQVALDNPMLWTYISFDITYEWYLEMAQRAKLLPLVLQHAYMEQIDDGDFEFLYSHLERTKELDLADMSMGSHVAHAYALATPAPLLEKAQFTHDELGCVDLPEDLFGFHAPRLHTAIFRGFNVPWTLPFLHLSHLEVTFRRSHLSSEDMRPLIPPEKVFFDLLANMHRLEYLSMEECFPWGRTKRPVVELPRLSNLTLKGEWTDVGYVLKHIRVPRTSTIHLDSYHLNHEHDGFTDVLIPFLEAHSGKTGDAVPLRTLHMDVNNASEDPYIEIKGWTTSDSADPAGLSQNTTPPSHRAPSFYVRLSYFLYPLLSSLDGPAALAAVLHALPIHTLSALSIAFRARAPEDYREAFEPLAEGRLLEDITCIVDACRLFCAMLARTPAPEGGEDDPPVLFPKLRFVKLLKILKLGELPFDAVNAGSRVIPADELIGALEQRTGFGAPLQRLELPLARGQAEYLDRLGAAVPISVFYS